MKRLWLKSSQQSSVYGIFVWFFYYFKYFLKEEAKFRHSQLTWKQFLLMHFLKSRFGKTVFTETDAAK